MNNRAKDLHEKAVVIVPHDHMLDEASLVEMAVGGVTAKVAIVSVDVLLWEEGGRLFQESIRSYEGWSQRAIRQIEVLKHFIEAHQDQFLLSLDVGDILRAKRENKSAILLGFEGGKPLEGSIEKLHEFYHLGVRQIQLTWAFRNQIAGGQEDSIDDGLTPFGREMIEEMNRLGMIADVTHLSRRAFQDVLNLTSKPVIASHAGSSAFCPDPGNLNDADLKALARNGGVSGVHLCSHIVKGPNCVATLDDLVDHIRYIADLVGVDHVGIGGDFFPLDDVYRSTQKAFMDETDRHEDRLDRITFVRGLERISAMPRLTEHLLARGFADEDICKIIGGNWLRIYQQVLDQGAKTNV